MILISVIFPQYCSSKKIYFNWSDHSFTAKPSAATTKASRIASASSHTIIPTSSANTSSRTSYTTTQPSSPTSMSASIATTPGPSGQALPAA